MKSSAAAGSFDSTPTANSTALDHNYFDHYRCQITVLNQNPEKSNDEIGLYTCTNCPTI